MFRNQEFRKMFTWLLVISLIGLLIAAFISLRTVLLVGLLSLALLCVVFYFTRQRYRAINDLSDYLRQISAGDYTLDVRDNYEGELSILKSNIYKVTSLLGNQQQDLRADKELLTEAISDISHQLKTPLTSMMVMADLLDDADLPADKRAEFTQNIHHQLKRLEWLVTSLLKLSKIESGSVVFKKETIHMEQLIKEVTDPFLIQMDVSDQALVIDIESELTFSGDFNWTAEALLNIFKNAVEHTPAGGAITISSKENVLFTELLIADTGPGIARDDLAYLFQRFYKGKHANADSVGIGLAMSYRIITSQGGDIEVVSDAAHGTLFRIKFYK